MDQNNITYKEWLKMQNIKSFEIWREAMAQLRRLSDDVWNSLKFFTTINGIIIAAILTKASKLNVTSAIIISILLLIGFLVTLLALKILRKQRRYYLEMLIKKSLIENELGFYQQNISGTSLSFSWKILPEDINSVKNDPEQWIKKNIRGSGVTSLLVHVYDALICIYIFSLIVFCIGFWKNWFQ